MTQALQSEATQSGAVHQLSVRRTRHKRLLQPFALFQRQLVLLRCSASRCWLGPSPWLHAQHQLNAHLVPCTGRDCGEADRCTMTPTETAMQPALEHKPHTKETVGRTLPMLVTYASCSSTSPSNSLIFCLLSSSYMPCRRRYSAWYNTRSAWHTWSSCPLPHVLDQ
jgi:hypothetical protein